jgi:L-fuculose-phosphate aldolase
MDGNKLSSNYGATRDLQPSSEIPMHLECYRQRADVNAVIHAHPPLTIACTLAGISLARCVLPEVLYDLGTIPTAPYATPASEENPRAIRELVRTYDAIILDRHGSLTIGANLWEAYMRLERVEHSALVTLSAQAVGSVERLSDDAIQRLAALRRHVFERRGRDVCAECNACAVSDRHPARAGQSAPSVQRLEMLINQEISRALGR